MSDKTKRASRSLAELDPAMISEEESSQSEKPKKKAEREKKEKKEDKDKETTKSRPVRNAGKGDKREPKRETLRKKKGSGIFPGGIESAAITGSTSIPAAVAGNRDSTDDAELDKLHPDMDLHKQAEIRFTSDLCEAYANITAKSRDANASIEIPEIVFIGPRGSGKSTLLDSFFGHPVTVVKSGGTTRRPVFYKLINRPECAQPRVTIKRDSIKAKEGGEFARDRFIKVEDISAEVEKRNGKYSTVPIYIIYEHKQVPWDVLLIDTPGLIFESVAADEAELDTMKAPSQADEAPAVASKNTRDRIDQIVTELASPTNRIVVCVEKAKKWENVKMLDWIPRIDPRQERTIFAYSHFYTNVLQHCPSGKQINTYLSGSPVNAFFTSMFGDLYRAKHMNKDSFTEKMLLAYQRDLTILEELKYDKRFAGCIGTPSLKRTLLRKTWKMSNDTIPKLLKYVNNSQRATTAQLERVNANLAAMKTHTLRANASAYLMEFLHCFSRLITGSSEGCPSVHGETAAEERSQLECGEWINSRKAIVKVKRKWNVPYAEEKLYGGQQFERLLSEFKAIVDHTDEIDSTIDEVVNASGRLMRDLTNYAWSASDIVQKHSQMEFYPLIERLIDRAIYIFQKLAHIAENVTVEKRKNKRAGQRSPLDDYGAVDAAGLGVLDNVESYPYFLQKTRELFKGFLLEQAAFCREKCMDEFYTTRLIHWEMKNLPDRALQIDISDDSEKNQEYVEDLANNLWAQIRTRIARNITLKCHHFFLVPLETELAADIQGQFSCMSDEMIEEIFEVGPVKRNLTEEQGKLQATLARLSETEKAILASGAKFSAVVI